MNMQINLPTRKNPVNLLLAAALLSVSLFLGLLLGNVSTVHALSGSDFQAGRIIDDGNFYNGNAMSATEIQNFLNAKVPTCDTNGTQMRGNITRAAHGTANGYPPPYTCLRNYSVSTPSKSADSYCSAYTGGVKSAAQIIRDVGVACNLSQKTLLVLLQKEQSLVTDDWPWSIQYRSATGYGCPDTAACDSEYYGFFNQVYNAARQYQRYATQSHLFNFRSGLTSSVRYNPNAGCGSSSVYIQNSATAGLYNYTPYQPNAAALNNLYGTGDSCSAYGNRNFWRMYNDWFGSGLNSMIMNGVTMRTVTAPDTSPARGQTVSYSVSFTNNLSTALTFQAAGIVGRLGDVDNGANRDFGWQGPFTLQPGATRQFDFTSVVRETGYTYAWPALNYEGTYVHYNNWGTALNAHLPRLTVVSPLTSSVSNPVAGQSTTMTATIRNDEDQPLTVDTIGVPVRYYDTYPYDIPWATSSTLQPNETKAVSGSVTLDKAGPYSAWLSAVVGGQYNTLTSNVNLAVTKLSPNFTLTYDEGPNPTPAMGEDVVVKFKLRNNLSAPITIDAIGVVGRYDNPYTGANRDFGWVGPITFSGGEQKTFSSFVSNVSELNNFYAWVALNYQGGYTHYNNWGFMMRPHVPDISFASPLTINNGTTPPLGQSVSVTATIKNNEPKPIKYGALGLPARFYGSYNYDITWQGSGTLAASGQTGDTKELTGTITFDKPGPYTVWTSININGRYITVGNPRNLTF